MIHSFNANFCLSWIFVLLMKTEWKIIVLSNYLVLMILLHSVPQVSASWRMIRWLPWSSPQDASHYDCCAFHRDVSNLPTWNNQITTPFLHPRFRLSSRQHSIEQSPQEMESADCGSRHLFSDWKWGLKLSEDHCDQFRLNGLGQFMHHINNCSTFDRVVLVPA